MNTNKHKKPYENTPLITPSDGFFTVGYLAGVPAIPIRLHRLIDETIKRINEIYIPEAWTWVRLENRSTWKELLEIEESISVAIQGESEGYLRALLNTYYEMWVVIIEAFKSIKDKYIPF